MKRLNDLLKLIGTRPTIAIKFVLAVIIVAYGFFVMSPFYDLGVSSSALAQFFSTTTFRVFSGLFWMLPGIISLIEIFTHKSNIAVTTKVGAFGMFMAFLYYVMLRFVTATFVPWTWLFPLACSLISAILVLTARWNEDHDDGG